MMISTLVEGCHVSRMFSREQMKSGTITYEDNVNGRELLLTEGVCIEAVNGSLKVCSNMSGMQYTAEYTNTLFSMGIAIDDHMEEDTKTVPVLVNCNEDTKAHSYSCIAPTAKRNRLMNTNVGTSGAIN